MYLEVMLGRHLFFFGAGLLMSFLRYGCPSILIILHSATNMRCERVRARMQERRFKCAYSLVLLSP